MNAGLSVGMDVSRSRKTKKIAEKNFPTTREAGERLVTRNKSKVRRSLSIEKEPALNAGEMKVTTTSSKITRTLKTNLLKILWSS